MTTIPPERVKELRERLDEALQEWPLLFLSGVEIEELLVLLSDYAALRAENEELHGECGTWEDSFKRINAALSKAEAELLAAQMTNAKNGAVIVEMMDEAERQRPLIEAVMAEDTEPSFIEVQLRAHMNTAKLERLLRAALALREEKK